jgi:hypothetical protein
MFSKRTRRMALIGPVADRRVSVHTAGYPLAPDRMLPDPDVVLLVGDDKQAMLFRYSAHGELCGDTPHSSIEEAEQQAQDEYGEALLLPWADVPPDVNDAHALAIQFAADHLNQRG